MDENAKKVNPYRILGKLHNEGMDYVIGRISSKDKKDIRIEEIIEVVSEYLLTIYKENQKIPESSTIELSVHYELVSKVLNKYRNLSLGEIIKPSDISLSEEAKSYLSQLDNLNLEEADIALSKMKDIENNVLSSSLPDIEQQHPLIFIAIAEASIEYMRQEEAKKTNSLWSKFTYQLKNFPWKTDGKGAVGGAITAGVKAGLGGGALGGPLGIGIVVGIGAVGGAIGSSVQAIIFPSKENKRDIEAETEMKKTKEIIENLQERVAKLEEHEKSRNSKTKPKGENQ